MGGPLKRYVYIYEISLLLGKGGFVYMPQLVSCMRGAFALNVGCCIYEFRHRSEFSVVKILSLHLVVEVRSCVQDDLCN